MLRPSLPRRTNQPGFFWQHFIRSHPSFGFSIPRLQVTRITIQYVSSLNMNPALRCAKMIT